LANTDKQGKMKENIEANKETTVQNFSNNPWLPVVFNETDYELSTPDVEKTDAF
jgi:DNA polymerase-1